MNKNLVGYLIVAGSLLSGASIAADVAPATVTLRCGKTLADGVVNDISQRMTWQQEIIKDQQSKLAEEVAAFAPGAEVDLVSIDYPELKYENCGYIVVQNLSGILRVPLFGRLMNERLAVYLGVEVRLKPASQQAPISSQAFVKEEVEYKPGLMPHNARVEAVTPVASRLFADLRGKLVADLKRQLPVESGTASAPSSSPAGNPDVNSAQHPGTPSGADGAPSERVIDSTQSPPTSG